MPNVLNEDEKSIARIIIKTYLIGQSIPSYFDMIERINPIDIESTYNRYIKFIENLATDIMSE